MLHPIRTCAGLTAAVLMLLCALALVPRVYAPWWPLDWIAAITPWIIIPTVLALLLGLLGRAWVVMTITAVLLALQVWWQAPLYLPDARTSNPAAVTVMTSNLRYGQADADAIVRAVREHHVDVLAVQELTSEAVARLKAAGLGEQLPYQYLAPEADVSGTGIYARTPLTQNRPIESSGATHQLAARTVLDGTAFTVASVHPPAPGPSGHEAWATTLTSLGAFATDVRGPLLMAGDYNATWDQGAFRDLLATGGLTDAVDQSGAGISFTFPTDRLPTPIVTIDHQLSKNLPWVATGVTVFDIPATDHRALIVTYARPD